MHRKQCPISLLTEPVSPSGTEKNLQLNLEMGANTKGPGEREHLSLTRAIERETTGDVVRLRDDRLWRLSLRQQRFANDRLASACPNR